MRFSVMIAILGLIGCTADRVALTEFVPTDAGFEYKAYANAIYPVDGEQAEAMRIEWLEKYLEDNSVCDAGYTITERMPVRRSTTMWRIHYEGICADR